MTEGREDGLNSTKLDSREADRDEGRKDEPIEEAEKDLSRYSTKDSRPPVDEQGRTSVQSQPQEAARDAKDKREAERD